MKLFTLSFLLSLSLISFSQNPWDGLTNEELSGNGLMPDGKGYLFNYGNNYPESDLDPTVMNCINDIGNTHNATSLEGVELSFSSSEYTDSSANGAGSLVAYFNGTQWVPKISGGKLKTTQFFTKLSSGNCNNFDQTYFLRSSLETKKIRAMVKTDHQCSIQIGVIGNNNENIGHYGLDNLTILEPNRWTVIELEIPLEQYGYSSNLNANITGIHYMIYSNNTPITLYIDWLEIGSAVGIKSIPQGIASGKSNLRPDISYHSGDIISNNLGGFEYNYGDENKDLCHQDENINNIFLSKGITTKGDRNFYSSLSNSFYRNGSLLISYDGSQNENGYVSSRFPQKNCEHILDQPVNLTDESHRKIKAMVYSSKDAYIRIFAGAMKGEFDQDPEFIVLQGGTSSYLNPIFLIANQWTEVTFDIGNSSLDKSFTTDLSKIIGVTYSLMNTPYENTSTPFSVDLHIDWLEIGNKFGVHNNYTQPNLDYSLSGNYSVKNGSGYIFDFNTPDTTNQILKEINCIPVDSISNHIYNTNNTPDVKVTITKQGQEASSGALNLNFSNLSGSSEWVTTKFTQNDCQNMDVFGLDLTTVANQALSGTVKASQNATLKIALVQRDGSTYTIIEDASTMESVDLVGGVWTDINLDLNDVLNGNIVDLTTIVGVAYQITPATGNKKSGGDISLSIDQLKIGAATYKDISTTTAINTVSNKEITFTAFPNPANDILNIRSNTENCSYELINLLGQSVLKFSEDSKNVSDLTAGIYFLNCYQHDELKETLKIKIQ